MPSATLINNRSIGYNSPFSKILATRRLAAVASSVLILKDFVLLLFGAPAKEQFFDEHDDDPFTRNAGVFYIRLYNVRFTVLYTYRRNLIITILQPHRIVVY